MSGCFNLDSNKLPKTPARFARSSSSVAIRLKLKYHGHKVRGLLNRNGETSIDRWKMIRSWLQRLNQRFKHLAVRNILQRFVSLT
jgi:hypothetical protein